MPQHFISINPQVEGREGYTIKQTTHGQWSISWFDLAEGNDFLARRATLPRAIERIREDLQYLAPKYREAVARQLDELAEDYPEI